VIRVREIPIGWQGPERNFAGLTEISLKNCGINSMNVAQPMDNRDIYLKTKVPVEWTFD
jgi:hypothetical protein